MEAGYDGRQIVGINPHRRRSVIVRMAAETGERLDTVRIDNDPMAFAAELGKAGESPEVVLELLGRRPGLSATPRPLRNGWSGRSRR